MGILLFVLVLWVAIIGLGSDDREFREALGMVFGVLIFMLVSIQIAVWVA